MEELKAYIIEQDVSDDLKQQIEDLKERIA